MGVNWPPVGRPRMNSENELALRRTVEFLREAGTTVVLMIEPAQYPGEVPEADIREYLESIERIGRDLEVPVWNTYSLAWGKLMFADGIHFNRDGTEAFTRLIGGRLRALQ